MKESMKRWLNEKEYLKDNPGKHKMNYYCDYFEELLFVDGKKISNVDLNDCVKFKDGKGGENLSPPRSMPLILDRQRKIIEQWEVVEVDNVDYVKDNALVYLIGHTENGVKSSIGIILGYIDKKGMWVGHMGTSNSDASISSLHKIDEGILNALPQILDSGSSVVDFGCGNADYIKDLIEKGFKCEAYDGNPNTPEMTNGIAGVLDLSEEFDLDKKFDYVISLEVAEHIPKEYEEIYVDNLIRHTEYYLITSWAVKGQGGDGHVNEQDEDYVLNLYKEKGMVYNKEVSEALRNVATLGWFKKTIFVFEKK